MAYARKTESNESKEWKPVNGMNGFSVIGTEERFSISFEVFEGFRIGMNGCRVAKGQKGEFISYPAWKDKNGKYHDYCYMTFSEKESKNIIETLRS